MRISRYIAVSCLTGLLLLPSVAAAQRQIVTDHFYIYFSGESEHTARRVADVAEEPTKCEMICHTIEAAKGI